MANEEQSVSVRRRNLACISFAFLCVYTSFNAVNNLQSSVNMDKDIGLHSLGLISVASILTCFCLAVPIIYLCGNKWTIISGQVSVLIYVATNMYPQAASLYPSKFHPMYEINLQKISTFDSGKHLWRLPCLYMDSTISLCYSTWWR